MTDKQFPWGRLLLYCVLSAADLFFTWRLLAARGGTVYESNPIAGWLLGRYGWGGLAAYKVGTVLLVAGLSGLICRYRPVVGARVLTFGCSLLALVVVYSCFLPRLYGVRLDSARDDVPGLRQAAQALEAKIQAAKTRYRHRRALVPELAAGRCTLAEAVDRLERLDAEREPSWLADMVRLYGAGTRRGLIAANLIHFITARASEYPRPANVPLAALLAQYQKLFGKPCPQPCRDSQLSRDRQGAGAASRRLKAWPARRRSA
jgi:hypothetical protein